ncbi:MAG: 3-phosphoshikimate 1-carboxyvinyltransferase [Bacteroidales bacterium]|nr:3-phosphoshikimate 1-carboxyvinyltransferase [Bacteroidales bacterium]
MDYSIARRSDGSNTARITLPASKSISNRLLIIRALSKDPFVIGNLSDSDDTRVMIHALEQEGVTVDIGHAGTAMRFLSAYFAASAQKKLITGSERMLNRPIGDLVQALNKLGAGIRYAGRQGFPPVETSGNPLTGGHLQISAGVSSQFISALLLIAPSLPGGLVIDLQGQMVSASYIRMTLALMKQCGVCAVFDRQQIRIPFQSYQGKDFKVESDWSAASYWYQMVSFIPGAEVFLEGLSRESVQGDAKVASLFSLLGVKSSFSSEGVLLYGSGDRCSFFESDFIECPDLVQTFAVTLCFLGIPFRITGAETLRIKETDRIMALQTELSKFGFMVSEPSPGILTWDGKRKSIDEVIPIRIATYHDHRMAMAFAPASIFHPGLVIEDISVVSKSYPDYWCNLAQFGFEAGPLS